MNLERKIFKTEIDGEEAVLEISNLAKQANASVIGRYGKTALLVTAVMSKEDHAVDFFPLTVDYEERFYAAGKILGSRFVRREGRPSDEAILSARLIDRTIRPLFDIHLRRAVQVVITVLAYDEKHDPDIIALLATSTALAISDIPWSGPVAGIRFVSEEDPPYDAFFAGPKDKINMIEFGGKEVPEEKVLELFERAQKEINRLVNFQEDIVKKVGKPKTEVEIIKPTEKVQKLVEEFLKDKIENAFNKGEFKKLEPSFRDMLKDHGELSELEKKASINLFEETLENFIKEKAIKENKRTDGRKMNEIRPLYAEVGLFERTHGSALFIRGDTQILAITTLAPPNAAKTIETIEISSSKRFLLHYNFSGFSAGEISKTHGPGRREIGHGALAAKALESFIPSKDEFPYTIRVVAETLSSNGSTSMATVSASSLSLMDAGVQIKKHIAGISIGLMYKNEKEWKILTDIQGPEDHYGDMDLKIAGTEKGINAIQMDVKIRGITKEIFSQALPEAKKARIEIIKVMKNTLKEPRKELSPFAPIILQYKINKEKIGEVIGPGGKTIHGIISTVGEDVSIDIEEDGRIYISAPKKEQAEKVIEMVKQIVREYKVGEITQGVVVKILDFGAIVDLGGGQDGMIHVSELSDGYVKKVEDVVKVGDRVKVKIMKIENGKIGLSLKQIKE